MQTVENQAAPGRVVVKMQEITKTFPGVKALDQVKFQLCAGEVVALLGENGAGKSTLMKILSGVYTRDEGTMEILGKKIGVDWDTVKAQKMGVAIIHQELNMCKHLSVAENIFLGKEEIKGGILNERKMKEDTAKLLADLNMELDPDTIVGDLPVSKQQMVEIARALSEDAKILIMDEPTSALTSKEINELFTIIKKLRNEGKSIIYISHRLEELKHIVDRVVIMRDGRYITEMPFVETQIDVIISNMVGREITEKFPRVTCKKGKAILEVEDLSAGELVKNVSITVYEGEIVGISGLMGAGRTETTRVLFGVDPKDRGTILLDGKEVNITCPADAIREGIVLVPEDRKKDGLCTRLSVEENMILPNLDIVCDKFGVVKRKAVKEMTNKAISDLKIRLANADVDAGSLSGGNQQKIVVGKWLARKSRVVIFDEPTRGIDVAAKVEIYNLMNELKQMGIGVLFVSSEMPEIMGMSDRIIVMCDGRVTGEFPIEEATQDRIMTFATQFENKIDVE